MLHRAGLGYWNSLDLMVHHSWNDFLSDCGLAADGNDPRIHLLTKKARRNFTQTTYRDGDYLVLGKESSGLPEELLAALSDRCERIPMLPDAESLDNNEEWREGSDDPGEGNSILRRQDICGNFIDPDDYRISALNLSNAAAVAVYEALRQTGFPGMRE